MRISDWSSDVCSSDLLEFALHAIDKDFKVKFTHALDDRLTAFVIGGHTERRIFLRQTIERDAHFLLVSLGLALHRALDDGFGGLDRTSVVYGKSESVGVDLGVRRLIMQKPCKVLIHVTSRVSPLTEYHKL